MKRSTKIWLIIAVVLTLVGLIIFGGTMTVLDWDFSKLSTVKYETNEYTVNEEYKNISIVTDTSDIVFLPSEDSDTKVICEEQKKARHSVSVDASGALTVEINDTRKWYERIGISFTSPKITVYLPAGEYGALSMRSITGDANIPSDFSFESIAISAGTGDISCFASASGEMSIKTTTGDIRIENANATALSLSVSTGDVKLTGISCQNLSASASTGDITLSSVVASEKLTLKTSTGSVRFSASDASAISVNTGTGDVTGTLLSEKNFITNTSTGDVDVPENTEGGRCEITTGTGDIKIQID